MFSVYRKELKLYSPVLAKKQEIVVLNKIDALTPEEITEKAQTLQKACRRKPLLMSGVAHTGTTETLRKLLPYVLEAREQRGNTTSTDIFDDHDD